MNIPKKIQEWTLKLPQLKKRKWVAIKQIGSPYSRSLLIGKVVMLSLLIVHSIIPSAFAKEAESTQGVRSFFSFSDETSHLAKDRLQGASGNGSLDFFADQGDDEEAWDRGWDLDDKERNHGDIDTFFPLVDSPEDSQAQRKETEKRARSAEASPSSKPAHLFKVGQKTPSDSDSPTAQNQRLPSTHSQLVDTNQEPWPTSREHPMPREGISSAQKQRPFIYSETQETVREETSEVSQYTLPSDSPTSAGTKIIAVEPYSTPQDIPAKKEVKTQVLNTKKEPVKERIDQDPRLGVSGPRASIKPQERAQVSPQPRSPDRKIIAQLDPELSPETAGQRKTPPKTILINFNNVSIIEYIRFISRITNKNFVFDEADLQFNVTIISEEPTTIENVMTALIQELRIHNLSMIEQGNNLIIHRNDGVNSISRVNVNGVPIETPRESELITQVFKLNTLDPNRARSIIAPLLSKKALIEVSDETRHIIVTDLVATINQIEVLLKSIDSPNSGLVIGQYVVRNAFIDTLIELATRIMEPIAQDQPLKFVPHLSAKSIFVVSTPFLVERTISVLQHLDQFQGTTRIYDLDELKFEPISPRAAPPGLTPEVRKPTDIAPEEEMAPTPEMQFPQERPAEGKGPLEGKWEIGPQGNMIFRPAFPPGQTFSPDQLPQGVWATDPQNNWYFIPEGTEFPFRREAPGTPGVIRGGAAPSGGQILPGEAPRGRWTLDPQGSWIFQLSPGETFKAEIFTRPQLIEEELPIGHIDRTKFFIYKLQFRRGEDIINALGRIGESLQFAGSANTDLVATIQSAQWLETSNSLVFTGTEQSILRVKELILEIDQPLRQVFIEMLILETSVDDSLTYGVSWATRSGGGNTSTAQAFLGGADPLVGALATGGITGGGEVLRPVAASLATAAGYHMGIIGQRLTHNGTQFASLGALVTALHQRGDTNIVLNPKIITEDNKTAEIFVGINTAFQTQAVSNDEGSIITTNVEFRDVGTTLRVTPLIGSNDIITLEIEQEVSRAAPISTQNENISTFSPGPTTSINRTTTTVHLPDKHFLVISGMIQDEKIRTRNQFPCLGGIPIMGAAFSNKTYNDAKRNLMIFIYPQIIDTDEEIRQLTRAQQEIFKQKNRLKKSWKFEVDEGLDFMNIKPPCCDECE